MRVLVNAVESGTKIKEAKRTTTSVIRRHWWSDYGYTVGLFQWGDACSMKIDED